MVIPDTPDYNAVMQAVFVVVSAMTMYQSDANCSSGYAAITACQKHWWMAQYGLTWLLDLADTPHDGSSTCDDLTSLTVLM